MALDCGAGTGILSMFAARAGADSVVGLETSAGMCDAAGAIIARNGFAGRRGVSPSLTLGRHRRRPACPTAPPDASRVIVLNRDARRVLAMDSDGVRCGVKPDGQPAELSRRADLLCFELFDSGLLGEGCLHVSAHAKAQLLQPHAIMVPSVRRRLCPSRLSLPAAAHRAAAATAHAARRCDAAAVGPRLLPAHRAPRHLRLRPVRGGGQRVLVAADVRRSGPPGLPDGLAPAHGAAPGAVLRLPALAGGVCAGAGGGQRAAAAAGDAGRRAQRGRLLVRAGSG